MDSLNYLKYDVGSNPQFWQYNILPGNNHICVLPILNLQVLFYILGKYFKQIILDLSSKITCQNEFHNYPYAHCLALASSGIVIPTAFVTVIDSSMLQSRSTSNVSNSWMLKEPFCLNHIPNFFCSRAVYGRLNLSNFASSIFPWINIIYNEKHKVITIKLKKKITMLYFSLDRLVFSCPFSKKIAWPFIDVNAQLSEKRRS